MNDVSPQLHTSVDPVVTNSFAPVVTEHYTEIFLSYTDFLVLQGFWHKHISDTLPTVGHQLFMVIGRLYFISKTPDCPCMGGKCECKGGGV